jgi:hypothetical protein
MPTAISGPYILPGAGLLQAVLAAVTSACQQMISLFRRMMGISGEPDFIFDFEIFAHWTLLLYLQTNSFQYVGTIL